MDNIRNENLKLFIKALGSDWYLYNIDVVDEVNQITIKIGGAQLLNGTIRIIYNTVLDVVTLNTSILTDTDMYADCLELLNKFKDTDNLFQPTQTFFTNLGGDGMIGVRIIVSDENINSIYKVLELIEFKRKM